MAYDDVSVNGLLTSIDANAPTISNTLSALRRFREILYPDLADRNSLFLNIFGLPEFVPRRGLESTVAADLNTVRTQLDAAISGITSVLSARAAVIPFSGTLLSAASSTLATGAAAVSKAAGLVAAASTAATGAAAVSRKIAIAASANTSSTGAAAVSSSAAVQPSEMANIGGAAFTVAKNWDFGTGGNIGNTAALDAEFQYHDPFQTVANGANYGTLQVATSDATAINVTAVPVPANDGRQPHDPTGTTFREFTSTSLLCYVKPWVTGTLGPSYDHNGGDGSICSKYSLPNGGSDLNQDLVFETRCRVRDCPVAGYWFALWTVGTSWGQHQASGPEFDLVESFSSTPESGLQDGVAFHVNSVGGTDERFSSSDSWFVGLGQSGMAEANWRIDIWHTYTWVYRKDNTWQVYIDGFLFNQGTLVWRDGSVQTPMYFLFDIRGGQTQIWPVSEVVIPADQLPITLEIDYSRVFLRS